METDKAKALLEKAKYSVKTLIYEVFIPPSLLQDGT